MDSPNHSYLSNRSINTNSVPHYTLPSPNLLSAETLFEVSKALKGVKSDYDTEYFGNFPCYQPFPYAVQQSYFLLCGSCITDYATELVERKFNWEIELKNMSPSNTEAVIKNIKRIKLNKAVKLPRRLKKYIDYFFWDPEPMFSGNYNWLYTGGSLCQYEKYDETFLISGDFVDDKPGFNFIHLNTAQDEILQKSFCQLKAYSPVLQITCRPNIENLIICVRQKNYLSLFNANKVKPSQPMRLWQKKVSGSKLLTCVDVEDNCERVVITDTNHDINVFHLERKNKIFGFSAKYIASKLTGDAWNQIEFGDLGVYWALRSNFIIFDPRDFYLGPKFNFELQSIADPCENISSFAKSQSDPNFIYLSTTHSVLQVDLRKGKAVQRWTHLMKYPPQFMAVVKDKEKSEVLLLQSPAVDEISGIINDNFKNKGNLDFFSKSLPCLLTSVKDSLNVARIRGTCLSPSIAKRMNFPVTGMRCLKNNQGGFSLFTTNSGGDIFLSKIKSKVSNFFFKKENEEEIIKQMEIYESDLKGFLLKKCSSNFEFIDMSCVLQDFKHSKVKTRKNDKQKVNWKFDERYAFKSLNLFRDPMSEKTIQVWIPPEMRDEEVDLEGEMKSVEAKILEWMKTW